MLFVLRNLLIFIEQPMFLMNGRSAARLGYSRCPAFSFESSNWWNSPYLNHFTSADTVVASYTNPQTLNRYSYVTNNPLRYTDPTGHMLDQGDGAGSVCPDQKCKDDVQQRKAKKKRDTLDVHQITEKGYFQSWEGEKDIDPSDWQDLLSDIRDDVHSSWGTFLPIEATWYDTPFYNDQGNLSGRGCLGGKCYDRSELNYVAQGELWAAVGVSNQTGHGIVKFWKESKCLWMCERNDLQEENEIFDIGYHDYQAHYPPHPISPYDTIPGMIVPLAPKGPDM